MSRNSYHREWGTEYQRRGIGARIISLFIRILPKVGPLAPLRFRVPTEEAEKKFIDSFNSAVIRYGQNARQIKGGKLSVVNINLDTGKESTLNSYVLADESCQKLLLQLEKNEFSGVSPQLRKFLLGYFEDYTRNPAAYSNADHFEECILSIKKLRDSVQ